MEDLDLVNFEYFKVFYHVAKLKSITAASKELFLTQPTVTHYIQSLERELGCRLFERTRRGVFLTPEAEQLYIHVERAYEHLFEGQRQFEALQLLSEGSVSIGASGTTLHHFLIPYLKIFRKEYPNIKIKISDNSTPSILKSLKEGLLDFAVIVINDEDMSSDDYLISPLTSINDIFIGGREYKQLKGKVCSLNTLKKNPLICLKKGTVTRVFLNNFLSKNNIEWIPDIELEAIDLIATMVLQNFGIGFIPSVFVEEYIKSGEIFQIKLEHPIPERKICLVYNRRPLSKSSEAFVNLLGTKKS